jgi:hypothetical protein
VLELLVLDRVKALERALRVVNLRLLFRDLAQEVALLVLEARVARARMSPCVALRSCWRRG